MATGITIKQASLTGEEIQVVYACGWEAVITLVEQTVLLGKQPIWELRQ